MCPDIVSRSDYITMTSQWASWHLKSPVFRLFAQPFVKRKRQSFALLDFVRRTHRWPMGSIQKGPVTRKMFSFHDVILSFPINRPLNILMSEHSAKQYLSTRDLKMNIFKIIACILFQIVPERLSTTFSLPEAKWWWGHYDDVIMSAIAYQITSLTIVYLTVFSGADQRKHQSSASLAFVWGIHRDRWIPRKKGQLRGKCFHLMTSSCHVITTVIYDPVHRLDYYNSLLRFKYVHSHDGSHGGRKHSIAVQLWVVETKL